jgi:predicted nucleotidyltransferase
MSNKVYSIDEIQSTIRPIAESFGVERIFLFGSYARGEATPTSDIDFRVDKGQVKGFAFGGLINALSEALDKDVDVVTTASLDKDFLDYISKEEVLLYA